MYFFNKNGQKTRKSIDLWKNRANEIKNAKKFK